MPRLPILLLLFLAGEGAALACSCLRPSTDPAVRRSHAREVARGALALVEVELAAPYDYRTGRGERLRVRRTLAGRAPATFEVERGHPPSSASCDVDFPPGARTWILVYAPEMRGRSTRYRISASCTGYALADAAFRAEIAARMRGRR